MNINVTHNSNPEVPLMTLKQQAEALRSYLHACCVIWNMGSQDAAVLLGYYAPAYADSLDTYMTKPLPRSLQSTLVEFTLIFRAIRDTAYAQVFDRLWLFSANPAFGGDAPIDLILEGGVTGIRTIRAHLCKQASWQPPLFTASMPTSRVLGELT